MPRNCHVSGCCCHLPSYLCLAVLSLLGFSAHAQSPVPSAAEEKVASSHADPNAKGQPSGGLVLSSTRASVLEYRHDHASAPMYFSGMSSTDPGGRYLLDATNQDTLTLGMTAWFSRHNGCSVPLIVFDDSSPANQEKYYGLLEKNRTHNELYYAHPAQPALAGRRREDGSDLPLGHDEARDGSRVHRDLREGADLLPGS